uniref:Uncharacterized protein n=1 Tax=Nelumbo nucifera TaxID=4432 RepID=A0A822XW71_NELNU|nr:TPA_asm: hypothetical protein HUJ06_026045 [Nelumbo nucifera]
MVEGNEAWSDAFTSLQRATPETESLEPANIPLNSSNNTKNNPFSLYKTLTQKAL